YSGTAGSSIRLTGLVSGAQRPQFHWSFGDGTSARGESVTHVYTNAGTYTATLTVTDQATNASGTATATVTVSSSREPPIPVAPEARIVASMAYFPPTDRVVLFGGLSCNGDDCDPLDDTWTYDGTSWTQRDPADAPGPRFGAAIAFHAPSGKLVLFGG